MTKAATGLWVLMLALQLTACESSVKPPIGRDREVTPVRGGTLRTAMFVNIRSLDASVAFDAGASTIELLLYDRLVNYDANSKLIPQLAESMDISPDGRRYVFTLRRGVLFHDGTELKAQDIKRSFERLLHVKTPCPVPSYYERIVGYSAYHDGKSKELSGIRVEGDYVVSFQLSEPDASFLHILALPTSAPVCRSAGSTYHPAFSNHACGTGPFKLTRYELGQVIELVRHDGYWQKGKPYLDHIQWYLGMQPFTQRFKFERGDLDYMREFSDADVSLYRTSPAWKGRGAWEVSLSSLASVMNTEMPPFDNRHFRRAISFAVKREQIAMIRPGNVQPHHKIVPNAIIPTTPGYPGQHYDYQRALEEMRLAGYPFDPKTGEGGYPKEIPYLSVLDSFSGPSAEVIKQHLERIGVRIRIQQVGWPTYLARTSRRRTVPFGWGGWHADFPDPTSFFEPLFTTKSIQGEESQNNSFFSNAEVDRLVEKARRSTNAGERRRLYRRVEAIIAEEAPWATQYSYRYFELWHPYVHGYRPHPFLGQHVGGVWLDLPAQRRTTRLGPDLLPGHSPTGRRRGRTTLALAFGRTP